MEKYGVPEEPGRDKVAKDKEGKDVCPECGAPIEDVRETGIPKCPKDGTRPFEK